MPSRPIFGFTLLARADDFSAACNYFFGAQVFSQAWANRPSGDDMAYGFNTVARRVAQERRVITGMVVRS
jgi:hypothetical protein